MNSRVGDGKPGHYSVDEANLISTCSWLLVLPWPLYIYIYIYIYKFDWVPKNHPIWTDRRRIYWPWVHNCWSSLKPPLFVILRWALGPPITLMDVYKSDWAPKSHPKITNRGVWLLVLPKTPSICYFEVGFRDSPPITPMDVYKSDWAPKNHPISIQYRGAWLFRSEWLDSGLAKPHHS